MEEERPLGGLHAKYVRGELSRADFEGGIYTFVKEHPWQFKIHGWDEEDRNDFLGDLYPAIRRTIDTYKNTGSSFDAYLYTVIRWAAIGHRSRAAECRAMELAYWGSKTAENTCDPEPAYEACDEKEALKRLRPISKRRRQILALTLKCCLLVSDDFCRRIAKPLGLPTEELREKINGLRTQIAGRMQKRREIEEMAASQYYRCVVLEAKAAAAIEGSARKSKLAKSAAAARKRLSHLRAAAARISIEATNREVAAVLKVPKGTIDASLFFLRRRSTPLPAPRAGRV